jgi:hypothetical protein
MIDGYVKNPYAVYHLQVTLRFILPFGKLRAGLCPVTVSHVMVSLSNHTRLASGAFSEAVPQTWLWRLIARTA